MPMCHRNIRLAFLSVAMVANPSQADTLYKCQDNAGHTTYSNQSTAKRYCTALSRDDATPSAMPAPSKKNKPRSSESYGSAFLVNSTTAITNYHVVDGCKAVTLGPGVTNIGRVIALDKIADLAAVTLSKPSSQVGVPLSPRRARLGEDIIVIGYPLGNLLGGEVTVTTGAVSSFLKIDGRPMVQLTAPVQPGNSGGPILDYRGNVVGVVVGSVNSIAIARITGSLPQNVNFGIPLEVLMAFLSKNEISFVTNESSKTLSSAGIAERTRDLALQVRCSAGV